MPSYEDGGTSSRSIALLSFRAHLRVSRSTSIFVACDLVNRMISVMSSLGVHARTPVMNDENDARKCGRLDHAKGMSSTWIARGLCEVFPALEICAISMGPVASGRLSSPELTELIRDTMASFSHTPGTSYHNRCECM